MLPTPSTSHVSFDTIYEPAEDSYLLLDTLSSEAETQWLHKRFSLAFPPQPSQSRNTEVLHPSPLVVEVGTGSGVVLAFLAANAETILGRPDVLTLGTDVNSNACRASEETVTRALEEGKRSGDGIALEDEKNQRPRQQAFHTTCLTADLCSSVVSGAVDVLVFNPPYVPTAELPPMPSPMNEASTTNPTYEDESTLLSLSYAGGRDGMETTNRLLADLPRVLNEQRGVAYVLLCAQNKIEDVEELVKGWGSEWQSVVVGSSGKKAGWERLKIVRIWREMLE